VVGLAAISERSSVNAEFILICCLTFVPCLLIVLLGGYVVGKQHGWQRGRIQIEVISLKEGETLYGVMDIGKTHRFFVGRDASHEKEYE
jgi:hypothetical protein